ncbi:Beta-lactamase [Dirofilaria immitis]
MLCPLNIFSLMYKISWILLNVGLSFSNLILHHYRYVKHLSVKEFEFLLGNSRTFEIHRLKPSINRPLPNIFSDEIKPKALCSDEGKVFGARTVVEPKIKQNLHGKRWCCLLLKDTMLEHMNLFC